VFDALNDTRNVERAIAAVKKVGKHAQGTICYTTSPLHTIDGYVRQARELLDLVHLTAIADAPVEELGHGHQKQLEVAIAMGGGPSLLLLDEPTSGLTEHERQGLGSLLQDVARRATIVMAEHDVGFVRRVATRVTALSLGRKVAEGSAEEVFQTPEVRQVFLRGADSA